MTNPEFAVVNGKKYKINTDFRVALKCEEVAQDTEIDDIERTLAFIYLLFGDEGLNDVENYEGLLKAGVKFLLCGNEPVNGNEEKDIDLKQDERYIKTSFYADYKIDLATASLHWWDFFDLLNGLSDKTILSRVREIRNYDLSQVKDPKERDKIVKSKQQVAIKRKSKKLTEEQLKNVDAFYELTGIKRG